MNRLLPPSMPARAIPAPRAFPGLITVALLLAQFWPPQGLAAQGKATDAITWQGTVKYTETARSPEGQRVKSLEARFELITPLRPWGDFTSQDTWRNVVVTWADSGRWHNDEYEVEGGTVPETDAQWNVSDGLAVASSATQSLTPNELHTNRGDGAVEEVQLPTLPLQRVGSKILVQPQGVGLRLAVAYGKAVDAVRPKSGTRDRVELKSLFFGRQPPHVAGEGIAVDENASDEYAGLPPEVVASLKMMEAATANAGDESEEDQVTIMGLRMEGFIDFDGSTVSGSRRWTTSPADPGDYTASLMDEQTTVSHEFVWSFVPVKGK